ALPIFDELNQIVNITTGENKPKSQKVIDPDKIIELQKIAQNVPIAAAVQSYALKLILATQPQSGSASDVTKKYIRYGSSPRGGQAIVWGGKVLALMEGRYNVSFEDIRKVSYPALRHRLFLNFEAMAEGIGVDDIIGDIISSIEE